MSIDDEREARTARTRSIHENSSWSKALGIELLEVGPERVVSRVEAGKQHQQPYGILHGGVYASIVEDVASVGAGAAARAAGSVGVVGVNNSTDFIRSHSEGELVAEGKPIHVGRSQQIWVVEIRRSSDQKLVSRGQVRFHVLEELPRQASLSPGGR